MQHVHIGHTAVLLPQSLLWEQLPKCIAAIGYVDRCGDDKGIEAKRREGFVNEVFFDINARRTSSIVRKFILQRSEHIYVNNLNIAAKRSKLILNCESSEAK
jgi:hypothetical protein